jgi:phage terminase large subunit
METATNERTCKIIVSNSFEPLLYDKKRYLVLCGGRGSGKSEFAARKIFYRCQTEGGHRFLILRKVRKTAKVSVLEVMRRLLIENRIDFDYNRTDHTFSWGGNELLFDGLDEPEKIKSIKGLTGVWVEETTEFTETDFVQIDLAFREPGPHYKQIILSFNPEEALAPWLKKRFFDRIDPDATVHNSTVDDNPIQEMRDDYRRRLEAIDDPTLRDIYLKGLWAVPTGQIYNWDVVEAPGVMSDGTLVRIDEVFYGGDFGFSVDPAACIRIHRKADEFWVEEVVYQTGLINRRLGDLMREGGIKDNDPVYFDAAEPKSIQELYEMGFNIKPCDKGPDSVVAGIDYLKSKKIHIVNGSSNIIREASTYSRKKDKNGNVLPDPVKFNDHALDAIRYGIFTHCRRAQGGFFISEKSVY